MGIDAANSLFESLLRTLNIFRVRMGELFLEFVAGKIVNGLAHVLGAVLHRVDHAGDDERELDLVGDRLKVVVIVRYQISRTHRFGCVPVCAVAD